VAVDHPFLRDGIDVYIRGDSEVHFVFLATRKRIIVKVKPFLIQSLAWLEGKEGAATLADRIALVHGDDGRKQFVAFLGYLEHNGIVIEPNWLTHSGLSKKALDTQQRQLSFFLDVIGSPAGAIQAQKKISDAKLVVFGVGAVGSWLVRQLLGLGFRKFVLIDGDHIDEADIARHAFFVASDALSTSKKATAIAKRIREEFDDVEIVAKDEPLTTNTSLESIIDSNTALVINTADQPYIGYTSVLLSRHCVPRNIPLLVGGGFNAHLGSLSELIVPGVTPCADCYADYFQEALKDWQPIVHPVSARQDAAGGLCSLSVFAAGSATMKILRYFLGQREIEGGRGELLFDDYHLETFSVERNPNCKACSVL